MRAVQAGKLRNRITIEALTETVGDDGQPVHSWGTFAVRWASVEPLETGGREYLQGAAIESEVTHVVRLRWLPGVTAKHRVMFKNRILEIQSAADVEETGRMLVLMCKEQEGR